MSEIIRSLDPHSAEYTKDYLLGWKGSERAGQGTEGVLDRADARNVSHAWYDGYHDEAAGREKFAFRTARRAGFESPADYWVAQTYPAHAHHFVESRYDQKEQRAYDYCNTCELPANVTPEQAAHDKAAAAIESVPDANGQPLVRGARATYTRRNHSGKTVLSRTGTVDGFDTRGNNPVEPIDVARVIVWLRDDQGSRYAFNGGDLEADPTQDVEQDDDEDDEDDEDEADLTPGEAYRLIADTMPEELRGEAVDRAFDILYSVVLADLDRRDADPF